MTDSANHERIANTTAELIKNHLPVPASCGNWTSVSGVGLRQKLQITSQSTGDREQAYYQGNMIRALDCHWHQVLNDLQQGRVRADRRDGSDPATVYAKEIATIQGARDDLFKKKNIAHIEDCPIGQSSTGKEAFQSGCQEYTQRLCSSSIWRI